MDAQQFLAEFGHIANAPNGILQLRELVLVLAMQGRLLSQTASESASSLLETVAAEKQSLIASGCLRPPKPLPPITDKEEPNPLPGNWCWARFGELATHNSGKTLDSVRNSGHPRDYITTSNLYWGRFDLGNVKQMLIRDEELEKCTARKGDLLICEGGEAGRAAVWNSDYEVCFQNHVHRARFFGGINPFFAYRFFEKLNMTGEINAHRKGIGISNMSSKALAMIPFPLPPLEEQSRIVAKVDELMALCDKLEAQQQARRKLQNALRQSTLQAVASSQSPHELQTTWTRLADNFERLFHAPEDVAELRGLVLDMAMRGYLVEQDPMEESATVLCAHIEDKKRQISKDRKLKLQKSLPQIGEDEIPFNVPSGWAWIRLGQIAELINGDRGKNYPKKDEYISVGVPWINTGHIEPDGTLTKHHMNFISREKFESLNSGKIEPGDLVYCLRGATFGKTAFVTPYEEGAIASSLMIIRPIISSLSRFLYYYLISPFGRSQIFRFDNGTAQPNLSANSVGLFSYPLPPLQEQIRIADKIEQLMRVCDALELQLRQATEVAGRFSVAAVSSLTGIAIEQEEEPMKAPQTELIAPLRLGTAPDIKTQAPLATILARHNGEMSAKDLWQRFGGEIDAFYAQLKTEVAHGWILEPAPAEMREKAADTAIA
ncbi:restriction endonuclease subunit S [Alcaligenes phenolicus]|uniref:restriction endonuclease subunit S n=1 Tax=Alcaligenes phenolicus TaxID=232846 RepID=UPI000E8025BC|nr:restriction endonuclease subunit S [Alcaligenes phenolicus]HBJ66933.1 type I restriction endonuclease subunit S [Alcaligenes faecalis]